MRRLLLVFFWCENRGHEFLLRRPTEEVTWDWCQRVVYVQKRFVFGISTSVVFLDVAVVDWRKGAIHKLVFKNFQTPAIRKHKTDTLFRQSAMD